MMHNMAGLLLTAVAGYWVLERSQSHKGNLKRVGQVLGIAVILLSLLGLMSGAWCGKSRMGGKGFVCPFSKPFSGGPADAP